MFHLTHEIEASEMTALEAVLTVDEERARLEREADLLNTYITEEVRRTHHTPASDTQEGERGCRILWPCLWA